MKMIKYIALTAIIATPGAMALCPYGTVLNGMTGQCVAQRNAYDSDRAAQELRDRRNQQYQQRQQQIQRSIQQSQQRQQNLYENSDMYKYQEMQRINDLYGE